MARRLDVRLAAALLIVSTILVACAKRPATTVATAPAPTGGATTTAPVRPAPVPGTASPPGAGSVPAVVPRAPDGQTAAPGQAAPGPTASPGQPARATAPQEFVSIDALKDIHFEFDRYEIRPADTRILDENARWMNANTGSLILVEGHADERGTNEYNLALGERRAKAAMNYLVAQGVLANRITVISYGEERPLCTETTEECWARNRRAHFLARPR